MQNFRLIYKPFPPEIHGQIGGITGGKPGGRLTVMIDSTLTEEEQKKTLKHELAHIALGHLEDDRANRANYLKNVMELEAEADAKAGSMTEAEFNSLMQWQITF